MCMSPRTCGRRSVVEQAHEIQSFARELEHFNCMLPDKFVAGGIITKLPPSWISLALLMWKKRREQRIHVLEELREDLVPIWYRRTSSPTSSRTRASLMQRTSRHILPTSRRILITRRDTNLSFGSTAQNLYGCIYMLSANLMVLQVFLHS